MKPKKRNGGKKLGERKRFTVGLTLPRYQKFCEWAGPRSLSDALEDMVRAMNTRSKNESAPTSHDG